ncbi:TIM barrel protein [Paludisphaera sp.]|uniref:sugar phosphate isomerase/epimerase family protein n=1 Tax=Paludisphaera sp. TaxID=2017432 RepID=UPI00301DB314
MLTRRSFLGAASVALAGMSRGGAARAAAGDGFGGVRVGCITYSYRGEVDDAEGTLEALRHAGLGEVEIKEGPVRGFTGLPSDPDAPLTDAERSAILEKCAAMRKLYNDAGVNIHVHKIPFGKTDAGIDMAFEVARALGCAGITLERSEEMARRLAPFAEKHEVWIGFHNHANNYPILDGRDPILDASPFIGYSFDIGHYFAGTKGKSPIPVLEKYHDRIVNLHLKDRTVDGGNLPWGQGQTPIKEVLRLMKREKWTFPADIEVEYKIPAGSTAVAEVARCAQYCRDALA